MSYGLAFFFILLSLLMQILSVISGKFASLHMTEFSLRAVLRNYYYLASLFFLGLQAIVWPLALRRFPLFWAYLFMSGIYVAIPVVSHFIFKEKVSRSNIIGAVVITIGISLMCAGR